MNLHQNLHHFNLISQDDVGHGRKIKCFFNQNHKNAYKIGLFRNLSAVIERQRISSYILQIENGIPKFINRELVPQFAKHLKCSCSYLLGYTDLINGFWYDPQTVLQMPITPYRSEEINANTAMIRGYNRDPSLYIQCLRALKEPSLEKRKIYAKVLRNVMKRFGTR